MKTLILAAAVAVVLFQATLQMAWGEPQAPIQQIHGKLSLAGEILSIKLSPFLLNYIYIKSHIVLTPLQQITTKSFTLSCR